MPAQLRGLWSGAAGRRVRLCGGRWTVTVNALWLWWYGGLMLAMEGYLMYRAVLRCRRYNELPWNSGPDKPVLELYIYIALIVISIMCLPFFVITCLIQIGNYANDGTRLGRDNVHQQQKDELTNQNVARSSSTAGSGSISSQDTSLDSHNAPMELASSSRHNANKRRNAGILQMLWKHAGPLCHSFHIVAAFALLLPTPILEAQEIRYGFLHPDEIWSSELDILFGKNVLPPDALIIHNANITSTQRPVVAAGSPSSPPAWSPAPVSPAAPHTMVLLNKPTASPEMINYAFALIVFAIRYAAVFWYTHRGFSLLFSGVQLAGLLHALVQYSGAAVLYKFCVNPVAGLELALPAPALVVLYLLAEALVYFSVIAVFNFGFLQYDDAFRRFLTKYFPILARRINVGDRSGGGKMPAGCQGYTPHAVATLCLLVTVGCRVPIVYDYVNVYRKTGFPVVLACIVVDVCYMIVWIGAWFAFTVKQKWHFRVQLSLEHLHPRPVSTIYTIHNGVPEAQVTVLNGDAQETPPPPPSEASSKKKPSFNNGDGNPPLPPANGHAVAVPKGESPTSEEAPLSPTSVLRKSGGRRNNPPQRVKFVDKIDDGDVKTKSPPEQHKMKSGSKMRGDDKLIEQKVVDRVPAVEYEEELVDGFVRGRGSDRFAANSNNRASDRRLFDIQEDSTPENTLKRNYRSSLRDKCGEYYQMSQVQRHPQQQQQQETSAPAAQSSPVLRRQRPLSDSFTRDDLPLLHVHTDFQRPAKHSRGAEGGRRSQSPTKQLARPGDHLLQRGLPPLTKANAVDREAMRELPPKGPVGGQQRASGGRGSSRKSSDTTRHSFPGPRLDEQDISDYKELSAALRLDHSRQNSRDHVIPPSPRIVQDNLSLKDSSRHPAKVTYIHKPSLSLDSAHGSSQSGSSLHHDSSLSGSFYTGSSSGLGLWNLNGGPNRELKIITKPELNRRDSALPSSNETSSNESNDVLCSQV